MPRECPPKELESARLLAKRMHNKRLNSLYVSHVADDALIEISREEVESTVRLAEARLGIEEGVSTAPPSPEKLQDSQWLLDALADDERKRFIFSRQSIEKLQADNTLSSWIKWLRETFDQQEREMKDLLAKELEKQMPNDEEASKEKWKIKIRFLCISHSVRQKALNCWNDQVKWIKLFEGDKKKREVIAEIHLPEAVPVKGLWHVGYGETRRLLLALNIGSLGFFWWYSQPREPLLRRDHRRPKRRESGYRRAKPLSVCGLGQARAIGAGPPASDAVLQLPAWPACNREGTETIWAISHRPCISRKDRPAPEFDSQRVRLLLSLPEGRDAALR